MIAVFYDRKNGREVTSDQLMPINLVESLAAGDTDDEMIPTGRRVCPTTGEAMDELTFLEAKACGHFEHTVFKGKDIVFEDWKIEKTPLVLYLREKQVSSLGYKSEKCPPHMNWDTHCNISDLVFVRLEDLE